MLPALSAGIVSVGLALVDEVVVLVMDNVGDHNGLGDSFDVVEVMTVVMNVAVDPLVHPVVT